MTSKVSVNAAPLFEFLAEISQNNNREWLMANHERYVELRAMWYAALQRIIDAMASWEPSIASQTPSSVSYRFRRDTRFSLDKTPYKTYFSAAFSPWGKKAERAGYYLQVGLRESGDNGLWGGIYCPSPAILKKLRHAIVDNIEEFDQILEAPELCQLYPGWVGDSLKTAPKGWPKDHPQVELLRLKDYGKFHKLPDDFFLNEQWPERVAELLRPLKPLVDFLNYSIDE